MSRPAPNAQAELDRIAREHEIDRPRPEGVDAEVAALLASPGIDDPALEDLSDLPFATIDDARSRDLDQALAIERDGDGFRVFYALADAAHFVRPGTALFADALARGASYYLPGRVYPMLPRPLSEGIISLNPEVDRRAMVFELRLDADGECVRTRIFAARIRSRAKLSFEDVQSLLDGERPPSIPEGPLAASLRLLEPVGRLRRARADERDVVRYRRSEVDIHLADAPGLTFVVDESPRLEVELHNEQLSLLCNVEGARFLTRHEGRPGHHAIYRVHPPPESERLEDLERLTREVARLHGLPDEPWVWTRRQPLPEYLSSLPATGGEARVARSIHRQALLANGRSSFGIEPGLHFGVGAPVYARFSSPMREVVGVFLHKETWERLASETGSPDDEQLREVVVETANRSKALQKQLNRDTNRVVLDRLFESELRSAEGGRPVRPGTVLGLGRRKAYVFLEDPPLEVKVYLPHLAEALGTDATWAEGDAAVRGPDGRPLFGVGDRVEVEVLGRDTRRDRWKLLARRAS